MFYRRCLCSSLSSWPWFWSKIFTHDAQAKPDIIRLGSWPLSNSILAVVFGEGAAILNYEAIAFVLSWLGWAE